MMIGHFISFSEEELNIVFRKDKKVNSTPPPTTSWPSPNSHIDEMCLISHLRHEWYTELKRSTVGKLKNQK